MGLLKIFRLVSLAATVAVSSLSIAQRPAPAKKHLLILGEEKGYRHEAVSHAMAVLGRLRKDNGLWVKTIPNATEGLTKKKLEYNAKNLNCFDAVLFFTGGDLEMDAQQRADLLSFVHDDGKGFVGVHSAAITWAKWPEFVDMLGGTFDEHPWMTFNAPIIVYDPTFPRMHQCPRSLVLMTQL